MDPKTSSQNGRMVAVVNVVRAKSVKKNSWAQKPDVNWPGDASPISIVDGMVSGSILTAADASAANH